MMRPVRWTGRERDAIFVQGSVCSFHCNIWHRILGLGASASPTHSDRSDQSFGKPFCQGEPGAMICRGCPLF
jgi:hypothetical protein